MYAGFRKNSETHSLPEESVKGAGSRTGARSTVNGRFVPRSEVKPSSRESVIKRVKATKKTK